MLTFIIVYTLMSLLVTWFIHSNQKRFYTELMITKPGETTPISIHQEFEEFCRKDKSDLLGLFIGTFLFFWLKFIIVVTIATSCMICLLIKNSRLKVLGVVSKEECQSFKSIVHYHTMLFLFISGIIITITRPGLAKGSEISAIYSKYLGPDYKLQYEEGFACFISNHISFIDILFCMERYGAGFISKASVKSTPIIGSIASSLHCLFVDRDNSQDRNKIFNQITERQTDFLNGKNLTPIVVFPEGTTTSGRHVLPFRKGAFASLLPVKPILVNGNRYEAFHHGCGSSDVFINWMRALTKLYTVFNVTELPIMAPTEYMLNNFRNYGKENWEIYAEVVRTIYCEVGHLKKSAKSLRDSTRYTNSMLAGKYAEEERRKKE